MIAPRPIVLGLALLLTFSAGDITAREQPLPTRRLVVGTKEAPPFAIKSKDGKWTGISIELWREIASELKLSFEFRELDLKALLQGVADGSVDVGVAALTITPEREKAFDFTHPFYSTGLGIAVSLKNERPWLTVLKRFLSLAFFKVVAALTALLLAVGLLVWWFERKKNVDQFGGGPAKGIGAGFWWSAVTMTTVGYGDKAPRTTGGRAVALIWMFAAIIIISSFTAAITSSLTVSQLEPLVQGPQDLPKARVGTIPDTTSAQYLEDKIISFERYRTSQEGLEAIARGEIDAFVYDAPLLRYLINQKFRGRLVVLPNTFLRQDYSIALPSGSPLREPINLVLLHKIREDAWHETIRRVIGP